MIMTTKKLWIGFITVMVLSFSVLLYFGKEIYKQAPPIPVKVVKPDGTVLFTGQNIKDGQNVWQSLGGQEIGTVWGHGAYQAPDWSADWLHKEAEYIQLNSDRCFNVDQTQNINPRRSKSTRLNSSHEIPSRMPSSA